MAEGAVGCIAEDAPAVSTGLAGVAGGNIVARLALGAATGRVDEVVVVALDAGCVVCVALDAVEERTHPGNEHREGKEH